uniref:Cytochrome b6-f complex subunit 7 n=3 Tax=Vischeria TaxID=44431 RepID=A0A5P8SZT4_9STRA|nr:cytochrome b6-f complex subunit 7 [Vischeria sp. ACOI 3415]YP_010451144.1 cytochrome b6-f complex subunit 7 [Vischeria punctata]YP_010478994.1 cytochrome b6-f complex subunit 7 [Lietzensia polymorpha]AOW70918.1 cytochrome b6-f complex subunit 7 [Vischeria sp. CAUP Q 202]QFR99736.1 cytochrome b6-f complex subunit 7 [Vischeria stellata]QAA12166.1 cytochrome b6-f complex subunit 7 [Vischeria sp. ACOI 3415]UTV00925.1 cytochrome b6-f complex subunit 7 [Vischeria punctata]UVI61299.1 cytochrome 
MEEILSVGGIAFIVTLIGLSLGFLLLRVQAR